MTTAKISFYLLMSLAAWASSVRAQEGPPPKQEQPAAYQAAQSPPARKEPTHRFWDAPNGALFAGVAGARGLDYASTVGFRSRGVNEVLLSNSVVDNHALFAGIQAAGVAASIGVSYLFHRTGHHKLERWVSVVHIGVAVGGSIRNFGLQPEPSPSVAQ